MAPRLIDQGPAAIEAALEAADRPLSYTDPVHWHGLAEVAAEEAAAGGLAWARCAVRVYDALATDVPSPHSFDVSSMHVRARSIGVHGPRAGDSVLDPAVITAWVRSALIHPLDEALARSARFKDQLASGAEPSLDDARTLRTIKNRLGVLVQLATMLPLDAELQAWVEIRDQLV